MNLLTKNISAQIAALTQDIPAQVAALTQDIQVELSSSIIYAFSPIAKVEQLSNGYFLITITDKNGTTTALVPNVSEETIADLIQNYFNNNPIIEQAIEQHNQSEQAHQYIQNLIYDAIERIPTKVSQLENDEHFLKTFKEQIVSYPSKYEFPNIPSDQQKDMIFLDASTGDMYVFGLNNTSAYTSIGLASQDTIYGGDSIK